MRKKNFTLILNHFDKEHFGKDFVLVPFYIQQVYDVNVTIVYPRTHLNEDMSESIRGIKLHPIQHAEGKNMTLYFLKIVWYLLLNAKKIDTLMTFHIFMKAGRIPLLYKLLNRKGKAYVKLDIPTYVIERVSNFFKEEGFNAKIKKKLYRSYFKSVDLFSCESSEAYNLLVNNSQLGAYFKEKLIILENGCDNLLIEELGVLPRTFDEKENIILTVGRLGTFEKNTELLLEALKDVDFHDWKAYLIGPVREEFEPYVSTFFTENPQLKDKIIFTGAIYDKKTLWEYYSKAKVFVLSSRTESSGIVLYEAKIFKNYIISTPVGASADVIADGCGELTDIADPKPITEILNRITSGEQNVDVYDNIDSTQLYWSKQVRVLSSVIE